MRDVECWAASQPRTGRRGGRGGVVLAMLVLVAGVAVVVTMPARPAVAEVSSVVFNTDLTVAGREETVWVTATTAGTVSLSIDFNRNDSFEASEQVVTDQPVVVGVNRVVYTTPTGAFVPGPGALARVTSSPDGGFVDVLRELYDAEGTALAQCPAGSVPIPVSLIQNPSFESRTGDFRNIGSGNTINFAANWFDSHPTGGQYLYFDPPTFDSGPPAATMPIRAGADGQAFLGGHSAGVNRGEGATNTLVVPLRPGSSYVGFFSMAAAGFGRTGNGYMQFFGVNDRNVGHLPGAGVVAPTPTNTELLYTTPAVNYPGNGVRPIWDLNTFTLNPSQAWPFLRVEVRNVNPALDSNPVTQVWMNFDDFHMYECAPRLLQITKTSNATADSRPGDTISYTITATNVGAADFTAAAPAVVLDDLAGLLDEATYNNDAAVDVGSAPTFDNPRLSWVGPLASGATVTITYSVTVTGGGDGAARNVTFQSRCIPGEPGCPPPVTPQQCVNNLDPTTGLPCDELVINVQEPELSIVKSSTTTMLPAVGGSIPYTFTVTNTGNVTMTAIAVTDPNTTGVSCPVTTLAPGEATTCTGTHTVAQADVDAGAVVNTASVVGTPPIGPPIPPVISNQVTILGTQLPALSIVKSSTTVTIPAVGATIPYSFLVTNTGNVTMTAIVVTDPNTTGVACPVTTLAPAASMTCAASHTVVQADLDAGVVVNSATVVGTPPSGTPIPPVPSNQVTITGLPNPALSIVKASTSTQLPGVGEPIPYSFLVTNIGDVTMTGVAVTDPNAAGVECPEATLAPGTGTMCTGTHTVTQADLDAGTVVNSATVVGTAPSGPPIPPVPSNELIIPGIPNPALAIVKASTTTAILAVDQVVPYTFTVTNIGNLTMTAIAVTDPNATDVSCPDFTLAPGTSTTCTASHTVTQADIDAGALTNTATVVGTPPEGPPIPPVPSNEITIKVAQIESMSILKTSTTPVIPAVGGAIPYEFLVTNNGNVTMTAITVIDANVTGITCAGTTLAPAASMICTGTHTVVPADIDSGGVVNTAAVAGTTPDGTPIPPLPSNTVTIPGEPSPPASFPDSRFVALRPERILDTRTINPQVGYNGPKPAAHTVVELQVTGRGGVPLDNVTAVVMNLTVTESEAPGFVTAWPTGLPQPYTSAVNVDLGSAVPVIEQHLPNLVTVPVGAGGTVSIYTMSTTHLVADVAGFYQAVSTSHEGRFMPVDPARVLDTRPVSGPVGYAGPKPAAGQTVTFPVAGHGGVPTTGASAVMLTVTATETNSRGFVTAFPAGQVLPWASNLNAEYADQTIANQVVVPLGANGEVSLYTQNGTHLVADVAGWFTDGTQPSSATGLYIPIEPARYLDTRLTNSGARPPAGSTVTVAPATPAIPATEAASVLYNLTGTQAAAPGFITAYPSGRAQPWASNLNLNRDGQTLSAHATTRVGANDGIDLYTQLGGHLVVDVMGWFRK